MTCFPYNSAFNQMQTINELQEMAKSPIIADAPLRDPITCHVSLYICKIVMLIYIDIYVDIYCDIDSKITQFA